ncbi:hypothetical protein VTO73DRAFT_1562 [Trametes versicolor]
MLFTTTIFTSLFAAVASAAVLPRQPATIWPSPFSGTIMAPTADQAMAFGVGFPFDYQVSSWCEPAFAPFTVYLTSGSAPPVFDNVTADGALADGAFVFAFGKFVVSRFGLPQEGTPPPTSLTMPAVDDLALDLSPETHFFLTVIEEFDGCPGSIAVEYGMTFVQLSLGLAT